ncbi:hypothetical protein R6Q57_028903 [Mikania cordata]
MRSGKHSCMDLTGVSPLVGLRDTGFVACQAALKAESGHVIKVYVTMTSVETAPPPQEESKIQGALKT